MTTKDQILEQIKSTHDLNQTFAAESEDIISVCLQLVAEGVLIEKEKLPYLPTARVFDLSVR